jgi:hypothetical protein
MKSVTSRSECHEDHTMNADELQEEISMLEQRLVVIGEYADSAYEKLLSRAYSELLQQRRAQLSAMAAD